MENLELKSESPKNMTPKKPTRNAREELKAKLETMRLKDREPVKGIFRFYEVPGGSMEFCFKKYEGDPVERFTFTDGGVYTVPLGVAKHLNTNGWYPEYEYFKDEATHNTMRIGKKIRRFGFQSLEFTDVDELSVQNNNQIVTVTHI